MQQWLDSYARVRKIGQLNIKTKMLDFEARVLIGWLARVFASQPINTRASRSNICDFMLRWPIFLTASIDMLSAHYNMTNEHPNTKIIWEKCHQRWRWPKTLWLSYKVVSICFRRRHYGSSFTNDVIVLMGDDGGEGQFGCRWRHFLPSLFGANFFCECPLIFTGIPG